MTHPPVSRRTRYVSTLRARGHGGSRVFQRAANGGLTINTTSSPEVNGLRTLNIGAGGATLTGVGQFFIYNGGVVNNLASSLFDIQTDTNISNAGGAASLANAGTLQKSAGKSSTRVTQWFCVALLSTIRSGGAPVYGTPLERAAAPGEREAVLVGVSVVAQAAAAPTTIDATISRESGERNT